MKGRRVKIVKKACVLCVGSRDKSPIRRLFQFFGIVAVIEVLCYVYFLSTLFNKHRFVAKIGNSDEKATG